MNTPAQTRIIAYTDGSSHPNPGPGGWGCLLIDTQTNRAISMSAAEPETTNNRMEMMAVIAALGRLSSPGVPITIFSDSQYVINTCTKWIPKWKANNWRTNNGPVKNLDLVKELEYLLGVHEVTMEWVKGHSGDPGNEYVDALANDARKRLKDIGTLTQNRFVDWAVEAKKPPRRRQRRRR